MAPFTPVCCWCRVNVTWGPKEERLLITGVHTVADIYCTSCNTVLGWKYVSCVPCYCPAVASESRFGDTLLI